MKPELHEFLQQASLDQQTIKRVAELLPPDELQAAATARLVIFKPIAEQHGIIESMSTVRITETELPRDVHGVLEKVQQGSRGHH